MRKKLNIYLRLFRITQWIKNFVVFIPIIFNGQLFNPIFFQKTTIAFFIFCLTSSTSYVLNDIIDYPLDKNHPQKRYRPIAAGLISIPQASFLVFVLLTLSFLITLLFSSALFWLVLFFIFLHFFYSIFLKKKPILDIFTISFSFMLRTFAGEVVTGYHVPIWLLLTIFFGSLFMATVKRQAELKISGKKTRISLYQYNSHLLDFLTYTFSTATIIAYSTYTYVEKVPYVETPFQKLTHEWFPGWEGRKLLMMTIPMVVFGIARYAQLFYEKAEGEQPEKIITNDSYLIGTIFLFGLTIILLIYVL